MNLVQENGVLLLSVPYVDLGQGIGPNDRCLKVKTADGSYEELNIHRRSSTLTQHGVIQLPVIRCDTGRCLVELPSEAATGNWRLWIRAEDAEI